MIPGIGPISTGGGGVGGGTSDAGSTVVDFGGFGGSSLSIGRSTPQIPSETVLIVAGFLLLVAVAVLKQK